ncbi:MAG: alpha/beta hydrolase [Actinobacteria bacterium]|nr:alpha/beta hydrolase [Actinomycetota bacterium]
MSTEETVRVVGAHASDGQTGHITVDDGERLAYRTLGTGARPIVFLHGLTANSVVNWEEPGIADAIAAAGWSPVLLDARGHGGSGRSIQPDSYGWARHGQDVIALLDHLGIASCVIVGYSLGAGAAAWTLTREPRVRAAVLCGMHPESLVPWPTELIEDYVRQLRASGEGDVGAYGSSVGVSIANVQALGQPCDFRLDAVTMPVMVLNGADDLPAADLAALIPGAQARTVPGNHATAPLSPEFTSELLGFLDRLPEEVAVRGEEPAVGAELDDGAAEREAAASDGA